MTHRSLATALGVTALIALGTIIGIGIAGGLSSHGERRYVLYGIQRELKGGMPRSDVLAIVEKHDHDSFVTRSSEEQLIVWVSLGGAQYCGLIVSFENSQLVSSQIRGEDGPEERFDDAPPDIGQEPSSTPPN